jgi:hypothetical protein
LDAFGKPESGIFDGNLFWLGDYNECTSTIEKTVAFKGKYCKISNPTSQTTVSVSNLFYLIKAEFIIFDLKL